MHRVRRKPARDPSRNAFLGMVVALLICTLPTGCSPPINQCRDLAVASEQAARRAWESKDPKAARKASRKADRAASTLEKALNDSPAETVQPVLKQQLLEAQVAARSARAYAETAEQEHERQKRMSGLKVQTYKKGRQLVLDILVPQMAGSAAKAGETGLDKLSVPERGFAELTWQCVNLMALEARPAPVNDPAGWTVAANTVRNWNTNPPVEFQLVLALCFASIGTSDFALFELESINGAAIEKQELRLTHRISKGVFYSLQGWNRLASSEFEVVATELKSKEGPVDGDMIVALVHGVAAYDAMTKNDLLKMDAEIAESIRAWPNNPLSVYLTGERLAANGEWEKAAESLESQVAGTKDEWLAERLASRARALRDGKGTARSFVLDAPLVIQFGMHMLIDKMAESPARTKLESALSQARKTGDQLRQKIKLPWSAPPAEILAATNSPGAQPASTN